MPSDPAIDSSASAKDELLIPRHLGIIMDGNGRWAQARGMARTEGHRAGVNTLRRTVEHCIRYGVEYLTVFSFSSENWSRPKDEINFIFGLLRRFVASDLERLTSNNVRVRIIGERGDLDSSLKKLISHVESETAGGTGLTLLVAFNYGGKAEIAHAARQLARDVLDGRIGVEAIDENSIAERLYAPDVPDPDLIIRTSGEQRISNFLLWQSAYTEFVFADEAWPDFDEAAFVRALETYSSRERRFGGVKARTL